jgi:hypothetical protein
MRPVIEQNRAPGLKLVLVHEAHQGDIHLRTCVGGYYDVIIVNEFFQVAYLHGGSSYLLYLLPFSVFFITIINILLWLLLFLVLYELLFHKKVVFDPL